MRRALFVVAGLAVIAYLVHDVGPAAIRDAFERLSWRLLLVIAFPTALAVALDTLGWWLTLVTPVTVRRLLGVRLAGEAINLATPTASIGGEPVKAFLLGPTVPRREALASVVVDKTTGVAAQALALLAGLAVASFLLPPSRPLLLVMWAALVLEVICVGGFVAVQLGGAAGAGGRVLGRLGLRLGRDRQALLEGVDRSLRALYGQRAPYLAGSVACHLAAFAVATLEVYIVADVLGADVSLAAAFAVGMLGTAVKFVTFMVPGSLGALEGGNMALFAAFGLGAPVGLAYSLVRRIREIAWVAIGAALLHLLTARSRAIAGPR